MDKRLILFDFDGVIINNSEGIFNCIAYALDKMGLCQLPKEILPKFVGPSLFDSFVRYISPNQDDARRFVDLYRERYAPVGHGEGRLYEGITDVLTALKQKGYLVAVCSGKPYEFVKKITEKFGIQDMFEELYCPGFATHNSTKEEYIQKAMADFGVSRAQTLMVGDTVYDIRSAVKAGVQVLAVSYGFGERKELIDEKADYMAHTPKEIYAVITGECL